MIPRMVLALFLFGVASISAPQNANAAETLKEYRSNRLGVSSFKNKDYPESIRQFQQSQSENALDPRHHINLGDAYYAGEKKEAAQLEFKKALESGVHPVLSAIGGYNLGKTYEADGKKEEAFAAYQGGLDRLAADANATNDKNEKQAEQIRRLIKKAIEQLASGQTGKNKQQEGQDSKDGKDSSSGSDSKNENSDDNSKDGNQNKDSQGKQILNPKPKFKGDKMGENEAKNVLNQLKENEKKSQNRLMQKKMQEGARGKKPQQTNQNDW